MGDLQREIRLRLRRHSSGPRMARLAALRDRRAANHQETHHIQMGRPEARREPDRNASAVRSVFDCGPESRAMGAALKTIIQEELDLLNFYYFLKKFN